ncbi:MAG: hypothetical protein WCF17_18045 [Terracidiphilus sp.]
MNKAAILEKAQTAESGDAVTLEEAIKGPFVLEFLDLNINNVCGLCSLVSSSQGVSS